jgi:predicted DNA-binding ribbon-helix-helix protein
MNTGVPKRSIVVKGRKTSVSLEDAFWHDLRAIAQSRQLSVSGLIGQVEAVRGRRCNLSSALRVFVLDHHRSRCSSLPQQESEAPAASAAGAQRSAA